MKLNRPVDHRWETGVLLTHTGLLREISLKKPPVRLEYKTSGRRNTPFAFIKLYENMNLSSLELWLCANAPETFKKLPELMYSCPNLQKLGIRVQDRYYDSEPQWRSQDGRLLQLQTLHLHNFWSRLTDRLLSEMISPASMETLSLTGVLNIPIIDIKMKNLKTLKLGWKYSSPVPPPIPIQVRHLLFTCNSLEEVDLMGLTLCINEQVFKHLGPSLQNLRVHEHEHLEDVQRRCVLSPQQIAELGKHCTRLERLSLDIAYKNQWVSHAWVSDMAQQLMSFQPYDTFNQISRSLWHLRELELNLEIGIGDPAHLLKPAATLSSVNHIWQYIWTAMAVASSESPSKNPASQRLRVFNVTAGSFRAEEYPLDLSSDFMWEVSQQQRFSAILSGNADEAKRGVAKITCVELEALLNGTPSDNAYSTNEKTTRERAENGPQYNPAVYNHEFFLEMDSRAPVPE